MSVCVGGGYHKQVHPYEMATIFLLLYIWCKDQDKSLGLNQSFGLYAHLLFHVPH